MKTPRSGSKDRILRVLIGATLSSDLSNADLRQLARELEGGDLPHDLARLIRLNLDSLQNKEPYTPATANFELEQLDSALRLVANKKISKKSLLSMMSNILPPAWVSTRNSASTVRQLLKEFFAYATDTESAQLYELLAASHEADPFLRGISNRNG